MRVSCTWAVECGSSWRGTIRRRLGPYGLSSVGPDSIDRTTESYSVPAWSRNQPRARTGCSLRDGGSANAQAASARRCRGVQHMKTRVLWGFVVTVAMSSGIAAPADAQEQHVQEYRRYDGPPVSLTDLLREAAAKNPELIALRRQIEVARQRPAQERGLNPPM